MGSNYQTMNSEATIFLPNIYHDFYFNWQTEKNPVLDQQGVYFFSTAKTVKDFGKIFGKTRFVVWWFDSMSFFWSK